MKAQGPRRLISSDIVFSGRHIRVRVDRILTGGKEHTHEIVEHPGAVAILAVDGRRRFILEKQFRYALGSDLYEIPAGTLEEGETPLSCARRELAEETGFRAKEIIDMGSIRTSPGYTNEILHLFYAEAVRDGRQGLEADEDIEIVMLSASRLKKMLDAGLIVDGKTLAALFIAERLRLVEL
jgi:ADP-ribose pyrophosphatase